MRSRLGRFTEIAERLVRVSIENCDASDLIERLSTPDTVIYADPPYLASTRVARTDRRAPADYRVDMGGVDGHQRLSEALKATPAVVFLSGYPSDLYADLYADWHYLDFRVTAHSSNSATAGRSHRTERIWSNRPLQAQRLALEGAS
jgi:DNA adenine methylase